VDNATVQSLTALGAATIGYLFGALAPFITQAAETKRNRRMKQSDIASELFSLFDTEKDLISELRRDLLQQRISIAAYQLQPGPARQACLALVLSASNPSESQANLVARLQDTLVQLGSILYS
jgi:hypothetical protein